MSEVAKISVNIDGLRMTATRSMEDLYGILKEVIDNNDINESEEYELKEKFNYAASMVSMINCVYDDNQEDFNDLSHIDIRRFEFRDDNY